MIYHVGLAGLLGEANGAPSILSGRCDCIIELLLHIQLWIPFLLYPLQLWDSDSKLLSPRSQPLNAASDAIFLSILLNQLILQEVAVHRRGVSIFGSYEFVIRLPDFLQVLLQSLGMIFLDSKADYLPWLYPVVVHHLLIRQVVNLR